ncbi:MAG: replication initiation protein [Epsilonproteobacteria bacterium]|nr:replication initiation protein [Campylobacterota bacterium]
MPNEDEKETSVTLTLVEKEKNERAYSDLLDTEELKRREKEKELLRVAKAKHFVVLKKNNAITDAKNGELSLLAMKLQDAILHYFQLTGQRKMKLELSSLRRKTGLQKNNDYVDRITSALAELRLPIPVRDFKTKTEEGEEKEVLFGITSFLGKILIFKETQHIVDIEIEEIFLEYLVSKAGYTNINLEISSLYRSKYGYKLYEMYERYYNLPNREGGENVGVLKQDIDQLNEKFGTNYSHPSRMLKGITRGLEDMFRVTGVLMICFYHKKSRKFVFSWARERTRKDPICRIPFQRVEELTLWIMLHKKDKVENPEKYIQKLKTLIFREEFEGIEEVYRGMLQQKYGMSKEEIDALKTPNGRYENFIKDPTHPSLFL